MVTIAVLPSCPQCVMTKKVMDRHGIEYDVRDLSIDEEIMARVKELGYSQAPVVFAGDKHWSGFRPDLIKALAA